MMGRIAPITQMDCAFKLGSYMAPEIGSSMFCAEGIGQNGMIDACQVKCKNDICMYYLITNN